METFSRDLTRVLGAAFGLFVIGPAVGFVWACVWGAIAGYFPTMTFTFIVLVVGPWAGWQLGSAAIERYDIGKEGAK